MKNMTTATVIITTSKPPHAKHPRVHCPGVFSFIECGPYALNRIEFRT